jgi:hypothetical protein
VCWIDDQFGYIDQEMLSRPQECLRSM